MAVKCGQTVEISVEGNEEESACESMKVTLSGSFVTRRAMATSMKGFFEENL